MSALLSGTIVCQTFSVHMLMHVI